MYILFIISLLDIVYYTVIFPILLLLILIYFFYIVPKKAKLILLLLIIRYVYCVVLPFHTLYIVFRGLNAII